MTVAMPVWQGRISPVLDVASRFLVIQFEKGCEIGRREYVVGQTNLASLVDGIKEMGADIVVCGAVSRPLADWLSGSGLRMMPHVCGEIEPVIQAFLLGRLDQPEFRMPGCYRSRCGCHPGRRHRWGNPRQPQENRRST